MSRHEHFSGVTLYALRQYPPFTVYAHVGIVFLPWFARTRASPPRSLATLVRGRETTGATFQEADTSAGRPAAKSTEDDVVDYNTTHGVSQIMENINDDFLIISRACRIFQLCRAGRARDTFFSRRDVRFRFASRSLVPSLREKRREENEFRRVSICLSSKSILS